MVDEIYKEDIEAARAKLSGQKNSDFVHGKNEEMLGIAREFDEDVFVLDSVEELDDDNEVPQFEDTKTLEIPLSGNMIQVSIDQQHVKIDEDKTQEIIQVLREYGIRFSQIVPVGESK